MGLGQNSAGGFGWLLACGVACALLVSWHAPVRAQAAEPAHVPVAGQRSCGMCVRWRRRAAVHE